MNRSSESLKKTEPPASILPATTPWHRRDWIGLGIVTGLALIIRLVYLSLASQEFWFANPIVDSRNYHLWAQDILKGDILGQGVFLHSPLYAFFLAGLYYLAGGANVIFAAAVQLLLGALSCGLIYLLGYRLFSRTTGVLAGLAAAVYGMSIFFEGNLLTVVLIHLLNLLTLLATYWASVRKDRPWAWALPGALIGLSALTRPNVILFLLVLAAWIWQVLARGHTRKYCLTALAALGLSAGLAVLPVTVRNGLVLDEFLLSVGNGGLNFYSGNHQGATGLHLPIGQLGSVASNQLETAKTLAENTLGRKLSYSQSSRYWTRRAIRDILDQPADWFKLLLRKSLLTGNRFEHAGSLNYDLVRERFGYLRWPWLGFGVVAPFAFLGMVMSWRRRPFLFPLYGFVLVYWFSNVLLLVSAEYRYGLMPALFLFAGAGAEELVRRFRAAQWKRLSIALGLLVVFGILVHLNLISRSFHEYYLATGRINFGAQFARLGDTQRAVREFGLARDLLRGRPELQANISLQMGKALMQGKQYQAALEQLEDVHRQYPDHREAANTYANALNANKLFAEALSIRKRLLELDPKNPEYWVNLGITNLWAGNDQSAQTAFSRALALNPGLAEPIDNARRSILAER